MSSAEDFSNPSDLEILCVSSLGDDEQFQPQEDRVEPRLTTPPTRTRRMSPPAMTRMARQREADLGCADMDVSDLPAFQLPSDIDQADIVHPMTPTPVDRTFTAPVNMLSPERIRLPKYKGFWATVPHHRDAVASLKALVVNEVAHIVKAMHARTFIQCYVYFVVPRSSLSTRVLNMWPGLADAVWHPARAFYEISIETLYAAFPGQPWLIDLNELEADYSDSDATLVWGDWEVSDDEEEDDAMTSFNYY